MKKNKEGCRRKRMKKNKEGCRRKRMLEVFSTFV